MEEAMFFSSSGGLMEAETIGFLLETTSSISESEIKWHDFFEGPQTHMKISRGQNEDVHKISSYFSKLEAIKIVIFLQPLCMHVV